MDSNQYREFLLRSIPTAKSVSGGREVNCRCFYCPDSKDPSHGHFYISIPESKDEPSMYHCKKCPNKGIVTNRTLLEWNVYDENIAEELIYHNRGINPNYKKQYSNYVYNIRNNLITENDISKSKLDYINSRIGTNFTYADMERLKIVLNIKDLLYNNRYTIPTLTRKEFIIDQLNTYFMGFLSSDNAFINMRRVCKEGVVYKGIDKRYVNYNIFGKKINTSNYIIPNSIDLSQPNRVKIHIAEGPFDIVSIYENLRFREPGIYAAIGGSNYYGTIIDFIYKYKLPYCEVHIYPDNDNIGSKNKMEFIKRKLNSIEIPVIIHRNIYQGEKDFGVPLTRIKEAVYV